MMAMPGLIASDCVEIRGLKRLSGKYFIEQITHSLGSGYKMALDLHSRILSPPPAVTVKVLFLSLLVY